MVYDFLSRLMRTGSIRDKTIIFDGGNIITGGSVTGITRSGVRFLGGESGQELLSLPLESITEVRQGETLLFRRKKHIQKVYPRS